MWDLINAPQTRIFGVAIMLMVLLGVVKLYRWCSAVSAIGSTACCPIV
ncbi:prepilin peptidase-dependent protein A [Neisseria wadsworthii 9715]|uniref:Prepilin peptidase-dependent protein A n=1 Tax=Neisseria wadsworthii 9715 TaxID=1030841 RepID=G4CRV8_9NEIS|nr:hypothetical protein [Neisseria wadsworthii]EGZ44872.1 prepilin peptidase-dependent protein A [Neisseria wadsworthii 9715]